MKAVLIVTPKLSERVINGELLRHLAKTANDDQPGIRTNTTICLGKIAKSLGVSSRAKVLSAAFSRALRDPFVHARNAALMALAATADMFSEEDCATKMLPAICPSLVDKEKNIRDQANKTMTIYLERVRKYSETMPTTALLPAETSSAPNTRISTPQPGASSQMLGWAISSFTNKLTTATGEIQPNSNGARPTPLERPTSTPSVNGTATRPTNQTIASAPAVPKVTTGVRSSAIAPDVDDEDFGDGWGEMDDDPAASWADDLEQPAKFGSSTTSISFDDGGEPDFEGWLNAQAQAKTQSKKPLPKGLTKKAAAPVKPVMTSKTTTSAKSTAPTTTSNLIKPAASQQSAMEDEEEDWGDAWG